MRKDDKWNIGRRSGRMVCDLILILLVLVNASCGLRDRPESAGEGTFAGGEMSGLSSPGDQEGMESGMRAVAEFRYMPMSEPLEESVVHIYAIDGEWLYFTDTLERKEEDGDPYNTQVSRKRISDGYLEEGYIVSTKSTWEAQARLIFGDGTGNCYIFWKPSPVAAGEEDVYSLAKYGTTGELLWYVDYTPEELLGLGESLELGAATDDGRVFLYRHGEEGCVFAFGQDGGLEEVYTPDLEVLEGVAVGRDGRVYGYCLTGEEPLFLELGGKGEKYTCPVRPLEAYSGGERGICVRTWESMWSYDPGTGVAERLWDWADDYVQVDGGRIDRFFCDGKTIQMLFKEQLYYDTSHTRQLLTFAAMDFKDAGEYPGKQTITLASQMPGEYYLDILVKLYNRYSTRYRVEVVQEGSAKTLEMKLLQGKAADLIDISLLYADNLAELGAFEDLTDYYAASETVSFEDLLEPVRKGCVIRGRNVAVIPVFTINTLIEKEPWYTAENWTVWEFLGMGQGRWALPGQNPMEALKLCMGIRYGEHFVDYEKKECYFDNGEFGRILEECSRWQDCNEDGKTISYYNDFGSGEHILEYKSVSSAWNVVSDTDVDYSSRIIGYPGWEGGEHELYALVSLAMNSASENKEGAWDFLEYLLSDEMQDMEKYWYTGFPVKKDRFEDHLKDLYINPALLKPSIVAGLSSYEPAIPTEEDLALLREMVDSAVYKNWVQGNNPLWNIVSEEAEMYFAGDCPLEETVRKIQNRVQTYLDEL